MCSFGHFIFSLFAAHIATNSSSTQLPHHMASSSAGDEDLAECCTSSSVLQHLAMLMIPGSDEAGAATTTNALQHQQQQQQNKRKQQKQQQKRSVRTKIEKASSAAVGVLPKLCTEVVHKRSRSTLHTLKVPRPPSSSQQRRKNDGEDASAAAAAGSTATASALRRARDSFLASKPCITRSVFMGMLKMASESAAPLLEIVTCPELDSDGTVFAIRDVVKVCSAVFNAWALLNKQPSMVERQADACIKFLRSRIDASNLSMMIGAGGNGSADCRQSHHHACKEWENFKLCLQDADVVPVDLMVVRMRRAASSSDGATIPASLQQLLNCPNKKRGGGEPPRKMTADWYECKHWFVPHAVRYVAAASSCQAVVQRFTGWGVVDYHCQQQPQHQQQQRQHNGEEEEEEEAANNNVANDRFVMSASRSAEAAATGEEEGEEGQQHQQMLLLLTPEERKLKAQAGPFHAMVVDAARKAIEMVLADI